MEKYDANKNPTVYFSSSDFYHNQNLNSIGDAINGKIHRATGASLENVEDIITGTWMCKAKVTTRIQSKSDVLLLLDIICRFTCQRN